MGVPRSSDGRRPKGRLEAFSDGVFAIAITLLVLEIVIPHVKGHELLHEIFRERQMFLAYVVAFIAIGAVWMEHDALVGALEYVDAVFMRLNLLLLLFVAILPLPTGLMGEYAADRQGERVAVVFFGIVLVLQTLMLILMARHAERNGLFGRDEEDEREEEDRVRYQLAPSLVAFAVGAVIGLALPYAGLAVYLLITLYLAVPGDTIERLVKRRR
jgi:uncharacterized membrane protein